jgi:hypothetical protein
VLIRSLSYEYPILLYYDPILVHELRKKAGISNHLALLNGWISSSIFHHRSVLYPLPTSRSHPAALPGGNRPAWQMAMRFAAIALEDMWAGKLSIKPIQANR